MSLKHGQAEYGSNHLLLLLYQLGTYQSYLLMLQRLDIEMDVKQIYLTPLLDLNLIQMSYPKIRGRESDVRISTRQLNHGVMMNQLECKFLHIRHHMV